MRLFCCIFTSNPGIKEIVSYMKHYFKRDDLILSEYIIVSAVKISPVQTFVSGADPEFSERGFGQTSAYII